MGHYTRIARSLMIDPQRDQILLQSVGDQGVHAQALESGVVDAVFVDSVYSKLLKPKGMNILAEFGDLKQPLVSQSTIVPCSFLPQYPDVAEGYLKGEIEGRFRCRAKKQTDCHQDSHAALTGRCRGRGRRLYGYVTRRDRRPLASMEGMRNLQRLLRPRNPKIGDVKVEDEIDNRIMRKLEETGFIDKMYATYGAKL